MAANINTFIKNFPYLKWANLERVTPDILLRKVLADACLNQLPLLEFRENEESLWTKWEKGRSVKEIGALRQNESRIGRPLGPKGHWARKKIKYGRWYRPHRIDEVLVEWMNSAFFRITSQ